MAWYGEEKVTGKMRWFYQIGSYRPVLQQEWEIVSVSYVTTYEWRTVPGVVEAENKVGQGSWS